MDIFVFGSNLAGRHGKGAALEAYKYHGAILGRGEGLQGASYAIPTKSANLLTLPLANIQECIRTFINFARTHPQYTFNVTPIGCGHAGYVPEQIAPMFRAEASPQGLPPNVIMPEEFKPWL
jgi:hypothetical protein